MENLTKSMPFVVVLGDYQAVRRHLEAFEVPFSVKREREGLIVLDIELVPGILQILFNLGRGIDTDKTKVFNKG